MLKAVDDNKEPRALMLTQVTAVLQGGDRLTGYDGPYWEGTKSLQDETSRFLGMAKTGWFSTANGVIFNPEKIIAFDIDQLPANNAERQVPDE